MTGTTPARPRRARASAARVGVVIVNHEHSEDTVACVGSLESSRQLDLDVLVVDNAADGASTDDLRTRLGERARVVASGDNLGYAGGSNLGIGEVLAQGCELVWLLNPDTQVEPETLPRLLTLLDEVPDCGAVAPRIIDPGPPAEVWFDGGMVSLRRHGEPRHLSHGTPLVDAPAPRVLDVDYVTGAALLTRRATLETVGPLPEHYFLYFEETEWCLRARRAGWRVMVDQRATMQHRKRSGGRLPSAYHLYYMTRNRYLFVARALGGDPEEAVAQMRRRWLRFWRRDVEQHTPSLLPEFDALVERALDDARAGRDGRNDEIAGLDWPSDLRGEPVASGGGA